MNRTFCFLIHIFLFTNISTAQNIFHETFPDGTIIPDWFYESNKFEIDDFGKKYFITDFGAKKDSSIVQTEIIQQTIDETAKSGGVVVIPKGVFLSGALFFKPNTRLHIEEGGVLKGSDNIIHYPIQASRMEGQNLDYFPALINAYGVDGFSISGKGTINGNGLKYWKSFWQRREENPACTNLEVSRPRLVFIWNCNNVQFQDVRMINAGFWTNHFYKCNNVKLIDLYIYSPFEPVKAPSTDAIDIDACSNFLISGCYMSVNDDAIALKGGKGPLADSDPNNGENTNIIVENCEFGFCHSALTCGSESIHNKNVIMRNCIVDGADRLLWLKLRGDTPQKYEFIRVEGIYGNANSFIFAKPWTQFFDLKGTTEIPISICDNITLSNIELECEVFFNIESNEFNKLSNFKFENLNITAKNSAINKTFINGLQLSSVNVNGRAVE